MANRNSISLTLPGNPLGSVLRETAREARRSTRDPNATQPPTDEDLAALQQQITTLQGQLSDAQSKLPLGHALILTDGAGIGTFTYPVPNPFAAPAIPVIQATVAVNDNATVTITSTTQTSCTFKAWHAATGAAYASVYVFLTAFPSSFVP